MTYTKQILRVNLTAGTCAAEPLNQEWADQYLGQRGLATKYLAAEIDPKVDPLSPDNKMIMATGPLTGTMASTGEIEFAQMEFGPDGSFEIIVSRTPHPGNWLPMADDTTLLIVRQTFDDKASQVPADIRVERIGPGPAVPALLDPATIERQLMAAAAWTRGTANTFATWSEWFQGQSGRIYDGDQQVFWKAGGDPNIWYGHFHYQLAEGEALVIESRVPECRMWNVQIDNWWMESLDHVHRNVWLNNSMARYEPDGSVVVVCAERDPGWGNWVDVAGHRSGTGLWRWINATENVVPSLRVVKL